MDKKKKEIALFRLSVLGPLASRAKLCRGELKKIVNDLAAIAYQIPYSKQCYLSPKTIERWYYDWLHGGFDALLPKERTDRGRTCIDHSVQSAILALKKENPSRSLNTLKYLLENKGTVAKDKISRATLHRFLKRNQLSKRTVSDAETIERRSFEAAHAGDIWQGDVMHGPMITTPTGRRKVYLVSLMDDASRLIVHSAFCFGETALDIEGVLKQALLKRGIPKRIILDNGSAYRSNSLQEICARLAIRLVYSPAYEPQGKGKLERFHRIFREQFLSELIMENIKDIHDLNARLWAWLETVYHKRSHSGLKGETPIERWRRDLIHVRPLGNSAKDIDDYFYHRIKRLVKKDGTVTWEGMIFEVPYELVGEKVQLVVDPHSKTAVKVESLEGKYLGATHPLDKQSNCHRQRQRPTIASTTTTAPLKKESVVEMALTTYNQQQLIPTTPINTDKEEN